MFVYFEGSYTEETLWFITKADELEVLKISGDGSTLFDFVKSGDYLKAKSKVGVGGITLRFYSVTQGITLYSS